MKKRKSNFRPLLVKEIVYHYLTSPLGLIFACLFFLVSTWLFFQDFFLINQASLKPLFNLIPFLFLFFLPAITMNLFAEEKKSGTWEILLTLPIKERSVVISKFLAAFIFTSLVIGLTFPLVITLRFLGHPDWGVLLSSYLGGLFLAASYLALGLFLSSLTDNNIVAFLTTVFFLLINFFSGQEVVLSRLPGLIAQIISFLSLTFHYQFFTQGNILISSLIFYLSWIILFVWLTIVSLKSRDY